MINAAIFALRSEQVPSRGKYKMRGFPRPNLGGLPRKYDWNDGEEGTRASEFRQLVRPQLISDFH